MPFVHAVDLYDVPYDTYLVDFPYNPLGTFYAYSIKRNYAWSPYS
ncbi:MAG: hypothetical protein ACFE8C_14175 [Promethearchaeota archaeon]